MNVKKKHVIYIKYLICNTDPNSSVAQNSNYAWNKTDCKENLRECGFKIVIQTRSHKLIGAYILLINKYNSAAQIQALQPTMKHNVTTLLRLY